MDIKIYDHRRKILKLREELLAVEDDRLQGRTGCTIDELDACLDDIITENASADVEAYDENGSMIKRAIPEFRHKTITERLEAYYGKPIDEIEPCNEEEIDWDGSVGDEIL